MAAGRGPAPRPWAGFRETRRSRWGGLRPAAHRNPGEAPISFESGFPRRHPLSELSVSWVLIRHGEPDAESRSFAFFAFDFNPAPMSVHDHLAMKHPNAK